MTLCTKFPSLHRLSASLHHIRERAYHATSTIEIQNIAKTALHQLPISQFQIMNVATSKHHVDFDIAHQGDTFPKIKALWVGNFPDTNRRKIEVFLVGGRKVSTKMDITKAACKASFAKYHRTLFKLDLLQLQSHLRHENFDSGATITFQVVYPLYSSNFKWHNTLKCNKKAEPIMTVSLYDLVEQKTRAISLL